MTIWEWIKSRKISEQGVLQSPELLETFPFMVIFKSPTVQLLQTSKKLDDWLYDVVGEENYVINMNVIYFRYEDDVVLYGLNFNGVS
jgi:hypothetical protein